MSLDVYLIDPTATYKDEYLYNDNITHNLREMAIKAGIYKVLWRPEEIKAKYAKDIIQILEIGLADLKARPKYFMEFDSPNGWGIYEDFIVFVEDYLKALKKHPEAIIEVWR